MLDPAFGFLKRGQYLRRPAGGQHVPPDGRSKATGPRKSPAGRSCQPARLTAVSSLWREQGNACGSGIQARQAIRAIDGPVGIVLLKAHLPDLFRWIGVRDLHETRPSLRLARRYIDPLGVRFRPADVDQYGIRLRVPVHVAQVPPVVDLVLRAVNPGLADFHGFLVDRVFHGAAVTVGQGHLLVVRACTRGAVVEQQVRAVLGMGDCVMLVGPLHIAHRRQQFLAPGFVPVFVGSEDPDQLAGLSMLTLITASW